MSSKNSSFLPSPPRRGAGSARVAAASIGLVLIAAACSGKPAANAPMASAPTPAVRWSGVVLSASSQLPVSGVDVGAGTLHATTDSQGAFTISGPAGTQVTFGSCAYGSQVVALTAGVPKSIALQPNQIDLAVRSNLTKGPLRATISGEATGKADKSGHAPLSAICKDASVKVAFAGYATKSVKVGSSPTMDVVLEATPAQTYKQEVAWDAAQKLATECDLVHPDSRAYISIAGCIKDLRDYTLSGYQNVSIVIHSTTFLKWTFPRCALASFGPKTYNHTAGLNYTVSQTTPAGGIAHISGLAHFVQTKDGIWRWFPLAGCDQPILQPPGD